MPEIKKIVLTGGPCAGKTTALVKIVEYFSGMGYKVFTIPEVPTLFSIGGWNYLTPNRQLYYQGERAILETQLALEDQFMALAEVCTKPVLIVCDRGALDISAYSLIALCRAFEPLMHEGSSVLAMTYLGSTRVVPSYNIMGVAKAALEASMRYLSADLGAKGIRINCISSGPIKTLAASAVHSMRENFGRSEEVSPLHRKMEIADDGGLATYLASDMAKAITGQVIFNDNGFSNMVY